MQLICPSCDSRFLVPDTAVGPAGRVVECGQCRHRWRVLPPAGGEGAAAPQEAPAEAAAGLATARAGAPDGPQLGVKPAGPSLSAGEPRRNPQLKAAAIDAAGRRARGGPGAGRRKTGGWGVAVGWGIFALVIVALVLGAVLERERVMAWAPSTTPLYQMVGLAGAAPAEPVALQLQQVRSDRKQIDGVTTLVIEGEIHNPTSRTVTVPPLVATLTDPDGAELKRWVFAARVENLPPGGRARFETSTDDPPSQGKLTLNFVTNGS